MSYLQVYVAVDSETYESGPVDHPVHIVVPVTKKPHFWFVPKEHSFQRLSRSRFELRLVRIFGEEIVRDTGRTVMGDHDPRLVEHIQFVHLRQLGNAQFFLSPPSISRCPEPVVNRPSPANVHDSTSVISAIRDVAHAFLAQFRVIMITSDELVSSIRV